MSTAGGGASPAPRPPTRPVGEWHRLWRWCVTRLRGRDDTEHEQALIRLAIYSLSGVYVVLVAYPEADRPQILLASAIIYALSMGGALAILAWIVARPAISPIRRVVGMLVDALSLNGAMLVGGEAAMLLFPFLLWTVLGHGFRFGAPYLFAAALTALVLFVGVILASPVWSGTPMLDIGLILTLIILPAYFAVLLRKLTQAIQRAEEASRAKSRFLATMSHEFRTPLNAVIGMAELLRATRLDHDQRDMTSTIRSAAGSLLTLVNDLLDTAKIEARQLSVEVGPLDLHGRLAIVRAMLQHQASEKRLYLRLRLDPTMPWRLIGGMQPLHQVLVNLVANAIKFTEKGGILVDVFAISRGADSCTLRVEVRDTGIGVPLEQQQRVFERFTQVDSQADRRFGGTGLGLAIARELVDLQGGRIGLNSSPGQGSTFWFEMPFGLDAGTAAEELALSGDVVVLGRNTAAAALAARLAAPACTIHEVSSEEAAMAALATAPGRRAVLIAGGDLRFDLDRLAADISLAFPADPVDLVTIGANRDHPLCTLADLPGDVGTDLLQATLRAALAPHELPGEGGGAVPSLPRAVRGIRILLAEDNRTNQRVVSRLLSHAGHEVELADDGEEALERITRERFDLVLMDINMPGLSGIDTVKMLRFSLPPERIPPIVALSADATSERRAEAMLIGFSDYQTKPIDAARLIAAIDRLAAASMGGEPASRAQRPSRVGGQEGAEVVPLSGRSADGRTPLIDQSRLRQLATLDEDGSFLAELVEGFLGEAGEIIRAMQLAAEAGDAAQLRDLGHAMRSCAGHVGAEALRHRCLAWRTLDDHALVMRARIEAGTLQEDLVQTRSALTDLRLTLAGSGNSGQRRRM